MAQTAYDFRDTDDTGFAEYDIAGEEYQHLLDACFAHCDRMSCFIRSSQVQFPEALAADLLPVSEHVRAQYAAYQHQDIRIVLLRLTKENLALIAAQAESIFSWIDGWGMHHLEDPIFYRPDGSVFFASVVHEGECTLYPRAGEDVSCILSNPHWTRRGTA